MFPADSHVHTEWSSDAMFGSMERTCARAVEIGVPAVAFTDHADFTSWTRLDRHGREAGVRVPPGLDVEGYLETIWRCRDQFPGLRILTGVELGEPHWHPERAAALLAGDRFERVLGSVHARRTGPDTFVDATQAFSAYDAGDVVRDYLAEVAAMVAANDDFEVLTHIDFPLRGWGADIGPYDITTFEPEFRATLKAVADAGRILEINTKATLHPEIVRWWYEVGGDAVTFGSDAHQPDLLAREFPAAVALAEACGFRAGDRPFDPWRRA